MLVEIIKAKSSIYNPKDYTACSIIANRKFHFIFYKIFNSSLLTYNIHAKLTLFLTQLTEGQIFNNR